LNKEWGLLQLQCRPTHARDNEKPERTSPAPNF